MVAAMTRHLHSLRRLKRDHGWIHTLLGMDHVTGYRNVIYAGLLAKGSILYRIVMIHACNIKLTRRRGNVYVREINLKVKRYCNKLYEKANY